MLENFLSKLQNLPEDKKKFIFFAVMAVTVLILGFLGIVLTKKNISMIGRAVKNIDFPQIDTTDNQEKDSDGTSAFDKAGFEEFKEALEASDSESIFGDNEIISNVSGENNQVFKDKK